jgi:signal transduction histidine kinase
MLSTLVGVGIGLSIGSLAGWFGHKRLRQRSLKPSGTTGSIQVKPSVQNQSVEQKLRDRIAFLEIAYQQVTEMEQFKAGFLARTSHELRSPLNGMIGMHQLILSDLCDDPAEERDFITQAHAAALRMVDILDNLLAVSRTESGIQPLDIQPVQVAHLFKEVHLLTHLKAQNRNLRLEIISPDPELYILADPRTIRQVLVKLIDGAILQMEQGSIRLSAQPDPSSNRIIIHLEDQRPKATWQEAIDTLQTILPKDSDLPTPGLDLLAIHTLLKLMQGKVELLATTSATQPFNQIQCTLPWVQED